MKKPFLLSAAVFLFGFSMLPAQKPDSIYLLGAGGVPVDAISADLNNDRIPDLIWTTVDTDSIITMLGNGDGTFGNRWGLDLTSTSIAMVDVAAARFNNDNNVDIVVASIGSINALVFSGNGNGTLSLYLVYGGSPAWGVVTGNFDPFAPVNLNPDFALLLQTSAGEDSVSFYFGRGDGFFDGPVDQGTGGKAPFFMTKHSEPGTVPVLDHVAVANWSTGNIGIIRSNGNRTFQATVAFPARAANAGGIAWDFFDNDNLLDLAYTGYDNDSLFVLKGTDLTSYNPAVSYPLGSLPFGLASGDFTGDGHVDLAAVNLGSDSASFVINNGAGGFLPTLHAYTGIGVWGSTAADINNNGLPDLLLGSLNNNFLGVFNLRSPTVSPAFISGNPATGANLPLPTVTAYDSTNIASVELMYRQAGKTAYTSYALTAGAGTAKQKDFSGTLPGAALTNRGLEYFYRTSDGFVTASVEPTTNSFPFRRLRTTVSESAPPTPDRSYRLVSFPMGFSPVGDGHPSVQLSDDLGSSGPDSWRLFWWDPTVADTSQSTSDLKGYREFGTSGFPATLYFLPGRSMFLATIGSKPYDGNGLSTVPNRFIFEPTPTGDSTLMEYVQLVIDSGWNMIATPYPYTIHMDSVNILVPAVDAEVHKGTDPVRTNRIGSGNANLREKIPNGDYLPPSPPLLKPWRGYFLKNNGPEQVTLLFPKLDGNFPATAPPAPMAFAAGLDWKLDIAAKSGEIETSPTTLGTSKVAQKGYDQLDWELPPPMSGDLRVVFQRGKEFGAPGDFLSDIRPTLAESETWDFTVQPGGTRAIELNFDGLADVPADFDLILTDKEGRTRQDIRLEPVYRFIASENRHFELTVAPKTAGQAVLLPTKYELYQNLPNPFNPQTLIKYDLPEAANVRLEVFNILGQKVATLVDRFEAAGPKSALWEGTDDRGAKVSSGIYFYKLVSKDYVATKKMMLVK